MKSYGQSRVDCKSVPCFRGGGSGAYPGRAQRLGWTGITFSGTGQPVHLVAQTNETVPQFSISVLR